MDTLNQVMTDLLIDQDGRLDERTLDSGLNFAIQAIKAEKIIKEASGNEHKN